MNLILQHRRKIDLIDKNILHLLAERFNLARDIGIEKKELGIPILDEKRHQDVIKSRIDRFGNVLDEQFIRDLYELIHKESCRIQEL
jgi:chorismate mutase